MAALEILVSAVIALAGLLIPAVCLASVLRSPRCSLRRVLAVPVILAATLAFFRLVGQLLVDASIDLGSFNGPLMANHPPAFDALRRPGDLLLLALQGLPIVLLPWMLFRALAARRWRQLIVLLIAFVALILIIAVISLRWDAAEMQPGQYYSYKGCAWLLFVPAYAMGTLLAVWPVVHSVARGGWRFASALVARHHSE
jgi:hypothetical protein